MPGRWRRAGGRGLGSGMGSCLGIVCFGSRLEEFWAPFFDGQLDTQDADRNADQTASEDSEGNINAILRLSPTNRDGIRRHCKGSAVGDFLVRSARVFSLAELMWFWGHLYTAKELFSYAIQSRRLTIKRPHSWTNDTRRQAIEQHHQDAGRWGLGRDVRVGDAAWKGKVACMVVYRSFQAGRRQQHNDTNSF